MAGLFGRTLDVRIGPGGGIGRSWTELRCEFNVSRSLRKDPNTASISLYNVDPVSRGLITTGAVVQLFAGYGPIPTLLFEGTIAKRGVVAESKGAERVVTIEAGDGELAFTSIRHDRNYGSTTNQIILASILETMGLGLAPGEPLVPLVYPLGISFVGPAQDALDRICGDVGQSYSIQDGNVQILAAGSTRKEVAVRLTSDTGLIGSPSQSDDGVNLKSLLNGSVKPGTLVSVASFAVTGFYRADKVTHRGDTHGGEWTTEIEATPVGTTV